MTANRESLTGVIAGVAGGILIVKMLNRTEKIDSSVRPCDPEYSPPLYILNLPPHRRLGRTRLETHLENLARKRNAELAQQAAEEAAQRAADHAAAVEAFYAPTPADQGWSGFRRSLDRVLWAPDSGEYDPFLEIMLDRFDGSLSHINVDYSALGSVKRASITNGRGDQIVSDGNIGGIKKVTSPLINKSITFVIKHPVKTTFIISVIIIGSVCLYNNRNEIRSRFKRKKDQLRSLFSKFGKNFNSCYPLMS